MSKESFTKIFETPGEIALLQILLIIVSAWVCIFLVDRLAPWLGEHLPGRVRIYLLPSIPAIRLLILIAAIVLIIPFVIEPTFQNLVTILGAAGLAIGFAFKDYVSSVIAGVVAIYERPYRPGDWVELDGAYGEVRSLGLRSLKMITPDDTVVVIPHSKMWSANIYNNNDGARTLMCVADFYLEPQHDAALVRQTLHDVALTSPYLQLARPIVVIVAEKPWGTHYRLKAYPIEGRDQFLFTSDLTVRGKAALAGTGVQLAGAVVTAENT